MAIQELPIFCYYDKQRFTAFGSMDAANFYGISVDSAKKKQALYPTMGRKHIVFANQNRLVFNQEPRDIFRTINYVYAIVGTQVIQIDKFYNQHPIGNVSLATPLWFDFLAVQNTVIAFLTDTKFIYEIVETGTTVTFNVVTDGNTPKNPTYVAAFGNRFVVSSGDTPIFNLTTINVTGGPSACFTIGSPGAPLFATASGIIRQMGVLHNQLYIFCDYVTDIWANIPTQITVAGATATFPWKLNTSYNFDYGIADPASLDIDFGRMVWLAKNANGLVSFMMSTSQSPQDISSQAINVLLENSTSQEDISPFLAGVAEGFLYQYENTVFYRVSVAKVFDNDGVELFNNTNALEYNFETQTWGRVIELDGTQNRIRKHTFFNNQHLVTVLNDPAVYLMAGNLYYNELRNIAQPNQQAPDAFLKYPMRYELVTKQLFETDYSEFIDDYVEIDFVFGTQTFYKSNAPFINTTFVITEDSTPSVPVYVITEDDAFVITEDGNTPIFDDNHYNALFKPHIEFYYSDDGGVTFITADSREFSPLGQYRWRMRWYELSVSRNRCYKLIGVSSAPIVILGAVRNTRRASGGAN